MKNMEIAIACKMEIMEAEDQSNKDKAEADRVKAEKEGEKILGDQQKMDNITKKIFEL